MITVCEIISKSYFVFISYAENYIFRIPNIDMVLKMSKIPKKMERVWDYWATVEDLSKKFDISKRRVQQIIAKNLNVIEKGILIRNINYGSGLMELQSTPIYRMVSK